MYLKNIQIKNYRTIKNAQVNFEPGLNILIGKNGTGKSNLLNYIRQNVSYYSIASRSNFLRNPIINYIYTICYEVDEKNYELNVLLIKEKRFINEEFDYFTEIGITIRENDNIEEKSITKNILV